MSEKIICEKCGTDMIPIDAKNPVGMKCPNCGWGWAISFVDPIEDDLTLYSVYITRVDTDDLNSVRLIATLGNINYVQAKQMIDEMPQKLISDKAIIVRDIMRKLDESGIKYYVTPKFPYCNW